MKLRKYVVNSSMIKSFFYSWAKETLVVQFKNDSFYLYKQVPESVFDTIIGADSVGSTFNKLIVKGSYDYYNITKQIVFADNNHIVANNVMLIKD